jgi:anti-anti-sigma factor
MNIKQSILNNKAILYLSGNIDIPGSETLKAYFSELLENESIKEVLLDFNEVSFIGSTGVGRLLLFYKNFTSKGGKIRLVNLNEEIKNLFYALKLGKLFDILKD